MLNELLSVIHRDGGQYTAAHGYKKSFGDAIKIVAPLIQQPKEQTEMSRECLEMSKAKQEQGDE